MPGHPSCSPWHLDTRNTHIACPIVVIMLGWLACAGIGAPVEPNPADPDAALLCLPAAANGTETKAAPAQVNAPADFEEKLHRARQRKDRWKKRHAELEGQLQAARSAAEQTEALLRVCFCAARRF
jgi:hypothetical protein